MTAVGAARDRTRLAALALALAIALITASCGLFDGGSDPATSTTSPTPPSTSTTTTTVPVEEPTVTVLDAGTEPRQPLRVVLEPGAQASITVTTDLAVDQQAAGRTQRIDAPPVRQELSYEVGEVSEEGAEVTITLTAVAVQPAGAGLDAEEVEALDRSLAPLVGLRATGTLTPTGTYVDLRFRRPAGLDRALIAQLDATQSQLAALAAPLPTEAMGLGGRWTATTTADLAGTTARTATTYEITAIDDDRVSYRATIGSTAEPQPLVPTGLPAGSVAELLSSELTGSATGQIWLRDPGATVLARVAGPQRIRVEHDGTTTDLDQQVSLATAVRTRAD